LTVHQICSPIVNLIKRYVATKLEVFVAFLFRGNRRHRTDEWTDGVYLTSRGSDRIIK